jgi:DNA polymerase
MASARAFVPAAMNYGIIVPHADAANYVAVFRETNVQLVEWCDNNLNCAKAAVAYPEQEFSVAPTHLVAWRMEGDCLLCRLPSGRHLRYWQPRMSYGAWPDGTPKKYPDLTVLVMKGKMALRRTLWRGLAVENVTQAIAADLLACALENMDEAGLPVVLHCHDSALAECREDRVDELLPVFEQCMLAMPYWIRGLPIAADCGPSARFG